MTVAELEVIITGRMDGLQKATGKAEVEMKALAKASRQATAEIRASLMEGFDRVVASLQGSTTRMEQSIKGVGDESARTAKRMERSFSSSFDKLSQQAERFGTKLTAGLSLPFAAAVGATAKWGIEFDKQLRNVDSLAKLTSEQFDNLRASVIALAGDNKIRQLPEDLAAGLYDIYSSGRSGQEALDTLRFAAYGASAGLTDTTTSAKVLVAVLNSGIKGVSNAKEAMDVLFKEVDLGVNSFGELAAQLGDVLPTATTAGVTLQEIAAAMATLTRQGISAAESVTAINSLLVHIIKPSQEAGKLMKSLGIEYGAAALRAKGLAGWLQEAMVKTKGNQQALVEIMPEIRGMKALLALVTQDGTLYNEMLGKMKTAGDGAGATMSAIERQGLSMAARLDLAKKELHLLGIEFEQELAPVMEVAIGHFRGLIDWFRKLEPSTKELITNMGLLAIAFGPVVFAFGKVVGFTKDLLQLRAAVLEFFASYAKKATEAAAAQQALATAQRASILAVGGKVVGAVGAGVAVSGLGGTKDFENTNKARYQQSIIDNMQSEHYKRIAKILNEQGRDAALRFAESQRSWWERSGYAEEQVNDVERYLAGKKSSRLAGGIGMGGRGLVGSAVSNLDKIAPSLPKSVTSGQSGRGFDPLILTGGTKVGIESDSGKIFGFDAQKALDGLRDKLLRGAEEIGQAATDAWNNVVKERAAAMDPVNAKIAESLGLELSTYRQIRDVLPDVFAKLQAVGRERVKAAADAEAERESLERQWASQRAFADWFGKSWRRILDIQESGRKRMEQWAAIWQKVRDMAREQSDRINTRYAEYMQNLSERIAVTGSRADQLNLKLRQIAQTLGGGENGLRMAKEILDETLRVEKIEVWHDALNKMAESTTEAFGRIFDDLYENGFKNLTRNVLTGFSSMLAEMGKQWLMSQVRQGLSRLLGGILGGLFGGGGGASDAASGGLGQSPVGRAIGGPVLAHNAYRRNEFGGEIFVPNQSGRMLTANESKAAMAGNDRPIIINVNGVQDASSFVQSKRQIASALRGALRAA